MYGTVSRISSSRTAASRLVSLAGIGNDNAAPSFGFSRRLRSTSVGSAAISLLHHTIFETTRSNAEIGRRVRSYHRGVPVYGRRSARRSGSVLRAPRVRAADHRD